MLLYHAWGDTEQCTPEILKFLLSPLKGSLSLGGSQFGSSPCRRAETERFLESVCKERSPVPGTHGAWNIVIRSSRRPGNTKCEKTLASFISLNATALFSGRKMSAFPHRFNSLPVDHIPSYHKEIISSCCVINTHVQCGKHFPVDCLFCL